MLALVLILVCRKFFPKIPGYIVALFVGTALVYFLRLPVQTIGTRFGGIPSGLPALKIPHFHLDLIRPLIAPAITVAMLGAIESLMSAVVADRMLAGREAQAERGIDRAGRGEFYFAADGRLARDRSDCAHGDQHSIGSEDAGCRNDSRAHAAGDPDVRHAGGQVHSAGGACGDSAGGFLQHGRVGRDSGVAEALTAGGGVLVGHVCAHRVCRPDGCRGSGNDSGGAGFHPQGHGDDNDFTRDDKNTWKRASCTFCKTRRFRRTRRCFASMGRFCLARPTKLTT